MVTSNMQTTARLYTSEGSADFLKRLKAFFDSCGIEGYIVGGFVRDGLLGKTSYDIDLTVNGDALNIARNIADAFRAKFVPLDEIHQIARVIFLNHEKQWHLDFAAMRGSIEDDLSKRDFTINSIAVPLSQLESGWNEIDIIDPLDGIGDLERKVVQAASDQALLDDPARILRAFRLSSKLGFEITSSTESLIQRDSDSILSVSGERIREELGHILETNHTTGALRHMDRLGLLDILFPELSVLRGVEQPKEHYWNVFEHSMETVAAIEQLLEALDEENDLLHTLGYRADMADYLGAKSGSGLTRRALVRLAALLHDIAKPQTKAIHENGKMRFLGHAQEGAVIADSILERFRFSSKERQFVTGIIDQHLRPGHLSNAPQLPTKRAIYRYFRDTGDIGIDTLFLSLADHLATRGPELEMEGWLEHVAVTQYMLSKWFEDQAIVSPPKLINGKVLIEKFGLTPGPEIGGLLELVAESQVSGEITTEAEAFDFVKKELDKNHEKQR